jgi:hypothetical protein
VLPPATEKVDEELQDATSPEGSRSEDTESLEEIMKMMKLTASEEDRRQLDDDEEDQGNPSWAGAGLSQLASLQQANPMEPAKCLQLQRHRPQTGQPSMLSLCGPPCERKLSNFTLRSSPKPGTSNHQV